MKCNVSKLCGGCPYLALPYETQLQAKQKQVEELLKANHLKIKVNPIIGAQKIKGYRNKVIVGFAKHKGKIVSGLYAAHSHRVIATQHCLMHPELINRIIQRITEYLDSMKIELYNERTGTGLLRHVLIRYAQNTKEVMVVFVTARPQFPSRRNLVNLLVKEFPEIKTILQSVNARQTSVVMENEAFILYGEGVITDELCGLDFTMTANSFYQIHHDQCERLYQLAKKKLHLSGREKVLDTYCGIGTIGLTLADQCKRVTGVEINEDSIALAKENARQNHIRNAEFVAMDSTKFMMEAKRFHHSFDVLILDPPRAGTTKTFIESACSLHPQKILYISCDPKTLVRDLKTFFQLGYQSRSLDLVDMFPNTEHIESVVLLSRKASDSVLKRSSNG
ncbi:23S rRNA (uracil(1939)-C(5))-methyltransferase RlmD [Faecalicoccus acidiformans]|uniref:23S rRNA (uracil(1939)-C(5))-methyltransferase RlmD n=1 Tax=Faecalicoccus acidiformans TaxID=915173 RepID=UPI0025A3EE27|nr:23S rRNA (uracil(1939)-C(5))-methyltransferase RlmD [Faecalicoccus acidiformans]MDM8203694.1 23S rRNA (uracil(1939)-C(5))-methyltransferase RlmD [Faecalicoccus acidiformans]